MCIHPAFTCSKSTMEIPEKYIESVTSVNSKDTRTTSVIDFTHRFRVVDLEQINASWVFIRASTIQDQKFLKFQ